MSKLWILPAMAVLSAGAVGFAVADPTKPDRTIAREPAYQSRSPRYCLLVFGSEQPTRVWLVGDGDRLFVDRNGNGDLTDVNECVRARGSAASGRVLEFR